MYNTHRGIATPALIIVVALALVLAGSYSYSKLSRKEKEADDLLKAARLSLEHSSRPISEIANELSLAKSKLQSEIDRLQIFRESGFNPSSSYGLALLTIQKDLSDSVIGRTNDVYKLITTANIDSSIKIKLTQDRQELLSLIEAWNKAISTNGATQVSIATAADAAIAAAQQYANTLENAVENLTPQNSNLTETQIAQQQELVNQVSNTTTQANTQVETITPSTETVQNLEEKVTKLEEELGNAQNNSGDSQNNQNSSQNNNNSSNNPPPDNSNQNQNQTDPPFIPPPPVDGSAPQLIQGENTY